MMKIKKLERMVKKERKERGQRILEEQALRNKLYEEIETLKR